MRALDQYLLVYPVDLPESWDIERFFSTYTVSDSFFRAESEYQHKKAFKLIFGSQPSIWSWYPAFAKNMKKNWREIGVFFVEETKI